VVVRSRSVARVRDGGRPGRSEHGPVVCGDVSPGQSSTRLLDDCLLRPGRGQRAHVAKVAPRQSAHLGEGGWQVSGEPVNDPGARVGTPEMLNTERSFRRVNGSKQCPGWSSPCFAATRSGLYHRVWSHSDATVDLLPLDAVGHVPW